MLGVRGRRYLVVILAILVGLVGLYAAVGFLLVPRWTKSELVQLTARDFGRTLTVGDVRFNPFTWTLRITGFSFPDADGRPMISFGSLEVALGLSSVSRLAPSFTGIALDSPHVSAVVRRDGKLNFADLEKPFAQPAGAKPQVAANNKPFKLFIDRLAVTNGSATYEDRSRPAPFRLDLDPIGFELLDFSTVGDTAGSYQLTATIGQGGRLNWTGTVRTTPMALHGKLQLDGLSAPMVGTYLGSVLPAEISRGTISFQGGFAIDRPPEGSGSQALEMTVDVSRAQVSKLGVRPRHAASDYVQLSRLTLGNTHIDLGQRSVRVGEITLAGAAIDGWLDHGGKLNLLQLLGQGGGASAAPSAAGNDATPSGPPPGPTPRKSSSPAWRIAAPDVRIDAARVSFQDRSITPVANLILAPFSARITGYDSSAHDPITVSVQSGVNGKGQLHLTANGTLQPQALTAKLDLSYIDLRAVQPYLNKYTALALNSGSLKTTLDLERHADGGLKVAGDIKVFDLRTVDDDLKQDFIKWQALHIAGFQYASKPASLQIEHITAVGPYARVMIGADHTLNVSEALHPRGFHPPAVAKNGAPAKGAAGNPESAPAKSGSAGASMPITIGYVRIANGTADYADFSMQPNFVTGIQDLHGTIQGLSSDPSSRATVDLQGRVDRYAPVDISGVVNLLAATTYSDVTLKFRGLQLTSMTPYSVRFAGYKIASGTLDADLHYKVDHGRLNADHTLTIDQLQLGEQVASPHATKLPLRLAIALLKDRNGVIHLGLPVTGSLSDPQFSLGPLIGMALLNVLKKAVTAPFALLGRMVGGGPDMNVIDFAPGSATLVPAEQARAAAIAKALAQRPQLHLQIPSTYAADIDTPALAQRQLRHRLIDLARSGAGTRSGHGKPRPTAGREVLELPSEHYRLLLAAYQSVFGAKAALPEAAQKVPPYDAAILELQSALLTRAQVSGADLEDLAQRRAQAIRSAILAAGGVDAPRIEVGAPAARPAKNGRVTVNLGLK